MLRKPSRTTITRTASILQWGGVVLFVLYVYLEIRHVPNGRTLPLLGVVALLGLVGHGLDRICRRFDESEIIALKAELEAARGIAEAAHRRTDRRQVTEAGKGTFKKVLGKYPNQRCQFIVRRGDDEARTFAGQLQAVFQECGWWGTIALSWSPAESFPGVGMTAEPCSDGLAQMIRDVGEAFESDGIQLAKNWTRIIPNHPIEAGTIEINVGRRPIP
ncbi:MAG TPA: hypothetical protein VGI81_17595 [Tepidisphaeraceae bacterium]